MDRSNLSERAAEIAKAADLLSKQLAGLGQPEPSFEHGLPAPLHSDAPESECGRTGKKLLEMVDELRALLTEPAHHLSPELRNPMLSVHPIMRLGIAENFPPQGSTVKDLAAKLKLRETLVRRLLCHAATYHIFYQTSPDFFVHTAASKVLSENRGMRSWLMIGGEETLPGTVKTAEAVVKFDGSEEPEHCGWAVRNSSDIPIFRALANMPDRAMVFANAMEWHAVLPGYSPEYLISAFPWGSGEEMTVVDVGGGVGHVSQALAVHNPKVKFIVEDFPDVVARGKEILPAQFKDQISFEAHDFFNEQPVKGADVYLLRLICHDWSDKYAKMIIKALVPALKPGAKIVINDRVIPGLGEAHYLTEREARDNDMYMWAFQNARERTADDWKVLLNEVDPRFKIASTTQPTNSYLAILTVEFGY